MKIIQKIKIVVFLSFLCLAGEVLAGPYTEIGVNGYIGDDWRPANPFEDADAVVNPIFRGWATSVVSYRPTDQDIDFEFTFAENALGQVTGDHYWGIVSLGELDAGGIADGCDPGQITLHFDETIRDVNGYDFAVFENGIFSSIDSNKGSIEGQMFTELGFVEVSSDGINFVRFPAVSLTPRPQGDYRYLTMEISERYNLAGKHPNADGICIGTPFDLREVGGDPDVVSGAVDINNISYVRIVDIPGSGDFFDMATANVDPNKWSTGAGYDANYAIYDTWPTYGSGGFDLEAIGVIENQEYSGDINLNGMVDIYDLLLFASSWQRHFGQEDWIGRCDLAKPENLFVDFGDFAVFAGQWQKMEAWRSP